jgi:hypothetical protein
MAAFNPNAWYQISEGRVDNTTAPLRSNLQINNNTLYVWSKVAQAWQLMPVDGIKGRYLLRLNVTGVKSQLSSCYQRDEVHPAKTSACMRDTRSVDDAQKWEISSWGDGTFKMSNVANGTNAFVLDVHPGNPLFMNDQVEVTGGTVKQPAQHWIITSERAVDDGAYSTIYSGVGLLHA